MKVSRFTILQGLAFGLVAAFRIGRQLLAKPFGAALDLHYGRPQVASVPRAASVRSAPIPSVGSMKATGSCVADTASVPPAKEGHFAQLGGPEKDPRVPSIDSIRLKTEDPFPVSERVRTSNVVAGGLTMGVLWIYLYPDQSKARRVFKVLDRQLANALGFSRYFYEDVPYDPAKGTQDIMDGLKREVQIQLDRRQADRKVRQPKGLKPQNAVSPEGPTGKRRDAAIKQPLKANAVAAEAHDQPVASTVKESSHIDLQATVPDVVAPAHLRKVRGQETVGIVTQSGMTQRPNASGGTYPTYCLTVHDGTVEVPLFGVELQRQARDLGLRVGEQVRVVSMGKQIVDSPDGGVKFKKNLYQVSRVATP